MKMDEKEYGIGVKQDFHLAKRFYDIIAETDISYFYFYFYF